MEFSLEFKLSHEVAGLTIETTIDQNGGQCYVFDEDRDCYCYESTDSIQAAIDMHYATVTAFAADMSPPQSCAGDFLTELLCHLDRLAIETEDEDDDYRDWEDYDYALAELIAKEQADWVSEHAQWDEKKQEYQLAQE